MLRLAKPVMGPVTSPYGWRGSGRTRNFHNGIDWGWLFLHIIRSRRVTSPGSVDAGQVTITVANIDGTTTIRVPLIHLDRVRAMLDHIAADLV